MFAEFIQDSTYVARMMLHPSVEQSTAVTRVTVHAGPAEVCIFASPKPPNQTESLCEAMHSIRSSEVTEDNAHKRALAVSVFLLITAFDPNGKQLVQTILPVDPNQARYYVYVDGPEPSYKPPPTDAECVFLPRDPSGRLDFNDLPVDDMLASIQAPESVICSYHFHVVLNALGKNTIPPVLVRLDANKGPKAELTDDAVRTFIELQGPGNKGDYLVKVLRHLSPMNQQWVLFGKQSVILPASLVEAGVGQFGKTFVPFPPNASEPQKRELKQILPIAAGTLWISREGAVMTTNDLGFGQSMKLADVLQILARSEMHTLRVSEVASAIYYAQVELSKLNLQFVYGTLQASHFAPAFRAKAVEQGAAAEQGAEAEAEAEADGYPAAVWKQYLAEVPPKLAHVTELFKSTDMWRELFECADALKRSASLQKRLEATVKALRCEGIRPGADIAAEQQVATYIESVLAKPPYYGRARLHSLAQSFKEQVARALNPSLKRPYNPTYDPFDPTYDPLNPTYSSPH